MDGRLICGGHYMSAFFPQHATGETQEDSFSTTQAQQRSRPRRAREAKKSNSAQLGRSFCGRARASTRSNNAQPAAPEDQATLTRAQRACASTQSASGRCARTTTRAPLYALALGFRQRRRPTSTWAWPHRRRQPRRRLTDTGCSAVSPNQWQRSA